MFISSRLEAKRLGGKYIVKSMQVGRWRVAVTRDDKADGSVQRALEDAGFVPVSCPVLIEGPPPDPSKLDLAARNLESFDWVICASTRAVRAIGDARGSKWPPAIRAAAVGPMTAAAMREAGVKDPIVAETFTARALWEELQPLDSWRHRRVLIATVAGGRRDLIDGLRTSGADVTEVDAYVMRPRSADDIRRDWAFAAPDAVILGSAETARHLIDAIGIEAMRELNAVVPIGPTTAQALAKLGIDAQPPEQATFMAAVEKIRSLMV